MLPEQPASKRRFWVVRLPLPVVIIITFVGGASAIYRTHLNRVLGDRLQALKEAGAPLSFKDMDSVYPEVELRENAGLVFSLAFSKRHLINQDVIARLTQQLQNTARSAALSNEQQLAIWRELEKDHAAIALLHKGACLTSSRYPIVLRKDGGNELPHLYGLRHAANLLLLEGALAVETNNARAAIRSVRSLLALGQSLIHEPTLPSQANRWRCQALAVELASRIVNRRQLDDSGLMELQEAFHGMEASPGLVPAFYLERCYALVVDHKRLINKIANTGDLYGRLSSMSLHLFLRFSGRVEVDRLFMLDAVDHYIACCNKPFPERLRMAKDASFYATAKKRMLYGTAVLCPRYETVIPAQAHAVACLRTIQAVLAVERFRRERRRLPEDLAELSPAYLQGLSTDPYSGQVLRFVLYEYGYAIYSVGENLRDNDGRNEGNLDVVISVATDTGNSSALAKRGVPP